MQSKDAAQAALLLVEARHGGHRLADLPEELKPATLAQAYAIQDAVIARLGPIGGWKVGPKRGDSDPTCSPISASLIRPTPARFAARDVPAAEAEVEVAVRFGRDLPPRPASYGPDEVRAAIAAVLPAIELLSSRFVDRAAAAPLSVIADSQSNGAVVIGDDRADWQSLDLARIAMRLRLDGAEAGRTDGGPDADSMLAALTWLANHVADRTGGLKKGDVVITGARVGPLPLNGAATEADVPGLGIVRVAFD